MRHHSKLKDNDKILVSKLQQGDLKAFDTLYDKYSNKIFQHSMYILKNREDSQEIVQETFCRIWNKRSEINLSKSFKSFLFTISHHLIIDCLRLRLKNEECLKSLQNSFNTSTKIYSEIDYKILNKHIKQSVQKMPDKRRRIFQLSRENGFSHKEIANRLGITVKTVENQITLSLKLIKLKLGEDAHYLLLLLILLF
ncbi:MAG: RNA polymerase sigma-70 factor [bacterium]